VIAWTLVPLTVTSKEELASGAGFTLNVHEPGELEVYAGFTLEVAT
jgi:hypothetical protein